MRVGVVAIQGDFEKHLEALGRSDHPGLETREVRVPEELAGCDRLIIPGGESTAVGLLMERFGLGKAIQAAAKDGMPIWGTCMGMIMMASRIAKFTGQFKLDLLDIEVERNAFGAQVHSFEDRVVIDGLEEPVTGVFIRAPIVTSMGPDVKPLGKYHDRVVAVRQGVLLGTSFHPELTEDTQLHRYFLQI
jgi:5'-phosphate synthase pdxT subunit